MRFFLVVGIWIVIVGGLWGYISQRDAKRMLITAPVAVDLAIEDHFSVEITPTFSVEEDPFALTTTDSNAPPVEVKLNGTELQLGAEDVMRGKTMRLNEVSGVLAGHNEIYVNASPPMSENMLEHGMRVRVLKDGDLIVDKTVWSTQGSLVSGTVSFNYQVQGEAGHDH